MPEKTNVRSAMSGSVSGGRNIQSPVHDEENVEQRDNGHPDVL